MKKSRVLFGVTWIVLCACMLVGCANELLEGIPADSKQSVFKTYYDYGFHSPDKAVLLMDGSTVFVDEELIAGDVVTVYYTGELYIQETYPSTVVFHGGSIQRVEVKQANVCQVTVAQSTQTGEKRLTSPYDTMIQSSPDYVLTDKDGNYMEWRDLEVGTVLYCSFSSEQGNAPSEIAGLYTYLPRK